MNGRKDNHSGPESATGDKRGKVRYLRRMVRAFFMLLLALAAMLLVAGRTTYWQAWLYGGVSLILLLVASILFVGKTDLIEERARPGPGTKWWDKIFYALYAPLFVALFVVASVDAGRFGWTPELPVFVYVIAYLVHLLAHALILWSMWTNRFFSSRVRIQTDRGHQVVSDGPYRFARHPGYVGAILLAISIPPVLGSLWALIPAGVIIPLLLVRTHLEDTTLRKELQGYSDYASRVRYRLIPKVW